MTASIPEITHAWKESSPAYLCLEPLAYSMVHSHDFFEMEFALSGSVNHFINNKVATFRGGDIWFLSPSTVHHFYGDAQHPGVARYLLYFDPTFISNTIWKAIDVHALPFCIHSDGEDFRILQNMFRALLPYADNKFLPRTSFVRWTIEWIILYLFEKRPAPETAPELSQLQPALVYIQSHFRENITVEDVADTVHFSTAHFSRLFHKNMGMSYRDYVLNLRLSYAFSLLYSPDRKVSEACFESGFNSPEYFSRAFKKKFGISPEQHYLDKNPEKRHKTKSDA